ncbi:MAG: TIGR03790 family protein [Vicinamibacterales bacterium]
MVSRLLRMWHACAALVLVALSVATARAQTADQVLLVVNDASPDSVAVGEHYARRRGIPQERVLRLRMDLKEEVDRRIYESQVEGPIAAWFAEHRAQDAILFVVLSKDIPLRVAGTGGRQGTVASVDSELALLYRKMAGRPIPPAGFIPNPYHLGSAALTEAKPFTHEHFDIYLVTRLEGFTVSDVMALIDRGREPARSGKIVLDMKAAWTETGNTWLETAAARVNGLQRGYDVVLDETGDVLTNIQDVLGYYSWGSNDSAIRTRHFDLTFVPGAIAGMFVSSDGRTFKEPPADWTLGTWSNPKSFYAGSPQSLAADLVRDGVTGVAGHVAEPYLDATIRPDILFPAYLSGFTLAEAYFLAMPYLSWQTVVVGDPLCAVAPRAGPAQTLAAPPFDPDSELPVYFSARRLESLRGQASNLGIAEPVLEKVLRAESRLARHDRDGAIAALIEATAAHPKHAGAQLMLGNEFEQRKEWDKAAERYTLTLKADPNSVIALNNLAYVMAVRQKKPEDALVMAERAYALSRGNPTIADTVAWIHHLAGHKAQAVKFAMESTRGAQQNAEIQLHGAIIFLEAGQLDLARQAYGRVAALDRTLLAEGDGATLRAKFEDSSKERQ